MALETLFYYRLGNLLLVVTSFILPKLALLVKLIVASKLAWLQKGIPKSALIMEILSRQWPRLLMFTSFSTWLPLTTSLSIGWIKMPCSMETYKMSLYEVTSRFCWESKLVGWLCKSLYGQKQYPRAWFGQFNPIVQQFSMTQ